MKVFVKVKVLKSQGVKCRCTYGDTLPRGYLQVAWWWQRWCIRIRYDTLWGGLQPGSPTSTRVNHRLHCSSFGVPAKTTIPVYSHLGTHATSVVNSPRSKIITMTYECTEPSSAALPLMALYVTCSSGAPSVTITSSREPLEIKHKK